MPTCEALLCSNRYVRFVWGFLAKHPIGFLQISKRIQELGPTMTVNKPTNLATGDLIILIFCTQRSSNNTSTTSLTTLVSGHGFTLIRTEHDNNTSRPEVAAYYKIATGSEPASYSSSITDNGDDPEWKVICGRVTGHDAANPIGDDEEKTLTTMMLMTLQFLKST